jgi:hypothetical protein
LDLGWPIHNDMLLCRSNSSPSWQSTHLEAFGVVGGPFWSFQLYLTVFKIVGCNSITVLTLRWSFQVMVQEASTSCKYVLFVYVHGTMQVDFFCGSLCRGYRHSIVTCWAIWLGSEGIITGSLQNLANFSPVLYQKVQVMLGRQSNTVYKRSNYVPDFVYGFYGLH